MRLTLVTGAAGFIGGRLVAALAARGEAVRGLDRAPAPPELRGADWASGSVLDPETMARAVEGVGAVIHCAAIAQLWTRRAGDFERVNVGGTAAALAAARRAGARFVLVSSYTTLVAADAPCGALLDETAEHAPEALIGAYPRAKRAAEQITLAAAAEGADALVALPSAPIGAGDRGLTPPMAFLRDVARGALPALLDAPINALPVASVAEGLIAARDRGRPGRRYLLAGADAPLPALAAAIARAAGVRPPRFTAPDGLARAAARAEALLAALTGRPPRADPTGVALALKRPRFDAARAREALGFASGPLDPAIAEAVAWLRETGRLPQARP